MTDVLHHLRGVHASLEDNASISFYAVRGVLQEAIDEIERLTADNDRLRARLREEVMSGYDSLTSVRKARYSGPEEYADAVLRDEK